MHASYTHIFLAHLCRCACLSTCSNWRMWAACCVQVQVQPRRLRLTSCWMTAVRQGTSGRGCWRSWSQGELPTNSLYACVCTHPCVGARELRHETCVCTCKRLRACEHGTYRQMPACRHATFHTSRCGYRAPKTACAFRYALCAELLEAMQSTTVANRFFLLEFTPAGHLATLLKTGLGC